MVGTGGSVLTVPNASTHSSAGVSQPVLLCVQSELSPKSGHQRGPQGGKHKCVHVRRHVRWYFKLPAVLEFAKT